MCWCGWTDGQPGIRGRDFPASPVLPSVGVRPLRPPARPQSAERHTRARAAGCATARPLPLPSAWPRRGRWPAATSFPPPSKMAPKQGGKGTTVGPHGSEGVCWPAGAPPPQERALPQPVAAGRAGSSLPCPRAATSINTAESRRHVHHAAAPWRRPCADTSGVTPRAPVVPQPPPFFFAHTNTHFVGQPRPHSLYLAGHHLEGVGRHPLVAHRLGRSPCSPWVQPCGAVGGPVVHRRQRRGCA